MRKPNPWVMSGSNGNGIFSGIDFWKLMFLALAGYGSYHAFKWISEFVSTMRRKPTLPTSTPTHSGE